jgi:hypothetical protein
MHNSNLHGAPEAGVPMYACLLAIPLPELQCAENQRVEKDLCQRKTEALWHMIQSGKEKTHEEGHERKRTSYWPPAASQRRRTRVKPKF